MAGDRARTRAAAALAASRFADIRWVDVTGSTNADVLALARESGAEGLVVAADHQTAGRGRHGRVWSAPPGASLLVSVLLRPPVEVAPLTTMAVGLAMAGAIGAIAGFAPRLKWPNDLVWPGDGSAPDRKLAGILAEADWPAGTEGRPSSPERVTVVVGAGVNVNWPEVLPAELADVATAVNHIAGRPVDRGELLTEYLLRLDAHYTRLVSGSDPEPLLLEWRRRSATIGRRVRVETGREDVVGTAVAITPAGHLVVDTAHGERILSVGDVVHLRPM